MLEDMGNEKKVAKRDRDNSATSDRYARIKEIVRKHYNPELEASGSNIYGLSDVPDYLATAIVNIESEFEADRFRTLGYAPMHEVASVLQSDEEKEQGASIIKSQIGKRHQVWVCLKEDRDERHAKLKEQHLKQRIAFYGGKDKLPNSSLEGSGQPMPSNTQAGIQADVTVKM